MNKQEIDKTMFEAAMMTMWHTLDRDERETHWKGVYDGYFEGKDWWEELKEVK